MPPLIRVEPLTPGASAVVLNRAERRNALSIDLLDQFCAAINGLEQDRDQRVIVLRGDGPVFCAGLDLSEARDDSLVERSASGVAEALRRLRETSLVSIAAVQGGAYAGGAGLMAACDIVVAADDARIGFPEARRGLLPALISEPLKNRVREGDLRYLLLTGDIVTASEAHHAGLVQRVVPSEGLMGEAERIAGLILEGGPETIRRTKGLLNQMYAPPAYVAGDAMSKVHLSARRSDEAREGLAAFIEKRAPWWSRERSK